MKITKFEHSCVVIEKDGSNLLIDPVEFSTQIPEISNIDAIVITHKHSDHFQPEVLERFRVLNPDAVLYVAPDMIDDVKQPAHVPEIGKDIKAGNFNLLFFSRDHAAIVNGVSPCNNLGVIIDGTIVDPGDSFDNPAVADINVLFVANSAPWLKVEEVMKFITALKPKKVIPIHDALLSPLGHKITDNWVKKACDDIGAEYVVLNPGESIEI